MDLRDYAQQIIGTTTDDWTIIPCWGFGSGPSYLQSSSVWTTGKGDFSNIEIKSHSVRASLKSDLSIWIAWGYPSNPDFQEPWANQFPDSHARSAFVDFFYNEVLVFREIYVSVDGGRCLLPLPELHVDQDAHEVSRYTVPRNKCTFFKTLDSLERLSDFDSYFSRAGFEVVDDPWMV